MDKKFYLKTPAVLLMMFAAHQTAAHASEDNTEKSNDEITLDAEQTSESVTQAKTSNQDTIPVVKSINASEYNAITSNTSDKIQSDQTDLNTNGTITDKSTTSEQSTENANQTPESSETIENNSLNELPEATQKDSTSAVENPNSTEQPSSETVEQKSLSQKNIDSNIPSAENNQPDNSDQIQVPQQSIKTEQSAAENKPVQKSATTKTSTTNIQPASREVRKTLQPTKAVQKNIDGMSVNEFIRYKNYTAPVYQDSIASHLPKYAYRNGTGNPEGVIAHETANNTSTIWGEIQYMKNNYQNAFVHAYVDDNNIVETANTDYLAWGAGQPANDRFIHVELVRVQGKERFAKSINNYADYIATNLLYYNLPVDSAEYDGTGTLWSHKAVSNFLGGTDHSDPYGWFAQNGYTFDELTQLVTEKYNFKLNGTKPAPTKPAPTTPAPAPKKTGTVTQSPTSKFARLKSSATPIYSSVSDVASKPAGTKYGKTYTVNKKAVLNGVTYYSLTDESNIARGWVESKNLTQASRSAESVNNIKFTINNKITGIYSVPWGTTAQKINPMKDQINKNFNPTKKVKVNNTYYFFGTIDTLTGWVNGNHLTAIKSAPIVTKTVDLIGRTSTKGATVYTDSAISKTAPQQSKNMQYFINKEALKGSTKYYQIVDHANKNIGWVADSKINETNHKVVSWTKAPYVISNTASYLYSMPNGSSKQRIKSLSQVPNKQFNVVRTDQVGSSIWHKGVIQGTNLVGWIHSKYLSQTSVVKQKAPESLKLAVDKQMKLVNYANNAGPKVVYTGPNGEFMTRIATRSEVQNKMDTAKTQKDKIQKYQFLKLNESQGISTTALNKILKGKGILEGQGAAFAKASKDLNVNEIYLVSHALLESGNGTSQLSKGVGFNSQTQQADLKSEKKYYNMYGTKATDNNVLNGGIRYAYQNGWDTPAKAIIGGAKYVAKSYFDNQQFTLHQMRWNPAKTATHQYATDISWAAKNAERIAKFYKQIGIEGLKFFIHQYK